MNKLQCPSCSHELFNLEEDHAHCEKCSQVVAFDDVGKLMAIQTNCEDDDSIFERELSELLAHLAEEEKEIK